MQYYHLWILTKRTEPHQEVSQTIPSVTSFLITFSSVTMVKDVIIISQEVKALYIVIRYVTMVLVEGVREMLEVRDNLTHVEVVYEPIYVTFIPILG